MKTFVCYFFFINFKCIFCVLGESSNCCNCPNSLDHRENICTYTYKIVDVKYYHSNWYMFFFIYNKKSQIIYTVPHWENIKCKVFFYRIVNLGFLKQQSTESEYISSMPNCENIVNRVWQLVVIPFTLNTIMVFTNNLAL